MFLCTPQVFNLNLNEKSSTLNIEELLNEIIRYKLYFFDNEEDLNLFKQVKDSLKNSSILNDYCKFGSNEGSMFFRKFPNFGRTIKLDTKFINLLKKNVKLLSVLKDKQKIPEEELYLHPIYGHLHYNYFLRRNLLFKRVDTIEPMYRLTQPRLGYFNDRLLYAYMRQRQRSEQGPLEQYTIKENAGKYYFYLKQQNNNQSLELIFAFSNVAETDKIKLFTDNKQENIQSFILNNKTDDDFNLNDSPIPGNSQYDETYIRLAQNMILFLYLGTIKYQNIFTVNTYTKDKNDICYDLGYFIGFLKFVYPTIPNLPDRNDPQFKGKTGKKRAQEIRSERDRIISFKDFRDYFDSKYNQNRNLEIRIGIKTIEKRIERNKISLDNLEDKLSKLKNSPLRIGDECFQNIQCESYKCENERCVDNDDTEYTEQREKAIGKLEKNKGKLETAIKKLNEQLPTLKEELEKYKENEKKCKVDNVESLESLESVEREVNTIFDREDLRPPLPDGIRVQPLPPSPDTIQQNKKSKKSKDCNEDEICIENICVKKPIKFKNSFFPRLINSLKSMGDQISIQTLTNVHIYHLLTSLVAYHAKNKENLISYFKGLNEAYRKVNKDNDIVNIDKLTSTNEPCFIFYQDLVNRKILSFKLILDYGNTKYKQSMKFPDCGATFLRNLFLILLEKKDNPNEYDIQIIKDLEPIQEIEDFFNKYNNFSLQNSQKTRDEWTNIVSNINGVVYAHGTYEIETEISGKNMNTLLKKLLKKYENWSSLNKFLDNDIEVNEQQQLANFKTDGNKNILEIEKNGRLFKLQFQPGHYQIDLNLNNNTNNRIAQNNSIVTFYSKQNWHYYYNTILDNYYLNASRRFISYITLYDKIDQDLELNPEYVNKITRIIVPQEVNDFPSNFSLINLREINHLSLIAFNKSRENSNEFVCSLNSLNNLVNLKIFELQNNKIDFLPFQFLPGSPNLKQLNLSHNNLRLLPSNLAYKLINLEHLDLSHNQLRDDVSTIDFSLFPHIKNSGCLDHNTQMQIKEIQKEKDKAIKDKDAARERFREDRENIEKIYRKTLNDLYKEKYEDGMNEEVLDKIVFNFKYYQIKSCETDDLDLLLKELEEFKEKDEERSDEVGKIMAIINEWSYDDFDSKIETIGDIKELTLKIERLNEEESRLNYKSEFIIYNNQYIFNLLQNITSLTSLNMENTGLRNLPSSMNLVNLKTLNISKNRLRNTEWNFNLPNLTKLNLSFSRIHSLPNNVFEYLTNLNYLDLSNNRIDNLPTSLENLINLQYLNLDGNDLTSISRICTLTNPNEDEEEQSPECKLKNLESLIVSNNINLNKLPENIHKLKKLRYLNLSNTFGWIYNFTKTFIEEKLDNKKNELKRLTNPQEKKRFEREIKYLDTKYKQLYSRFFVAERPFGFNNRDVSSIEQAKDLIPREFGELIYKSYAYTDKLNILVKTRGWNNFSIVDLYCLLYQNEYCIQSTVNSDDILVRKIKTILSSTKDGNQISELIKGREKEFIKKQVDSNIFTQWWYGDNDKQKMDAFKEDISQFDANTALGKFKGSDECDLLKCVNSADTFCDVTLAKCQKIIIQNQEKALKILDELGDDKDDFIINFRKHSPIGFKKQYQIIQEKNKIKEEIENPEIQDKITYLQQKLQNETKPEIRNFIETKIQELEDKETYDFLTEEQQNKFKTDFEEWSDKLSNIISEEKMEEHFAKKPDPIDYLDY